MATSISNEDMTETMRRIEEYARSLQVELDLSGIQQNGTDRPETPLGPKYTQKKYLYHAIIRLKLHHQENNVISTFKLQAMIRHIHHKEMILFHHHQVTLVRQIHQVCHLTMMMTQADRKVKVHMLILQI